MKSQLPIHLLAVSLASGPLLSMIATACGGGPKGGHLQKQIRLADNIRRAMNGEI